MRNLAAVFVGLALADSAPTSTRGPWDLVASPLAAENYFSGAALLLV